MKKYFFGSCAVVAILIIGLIIGHGASKPQIKTPTLHGSYVALGDSVAAGVGLKDDSDSSACDRTNESYPHQVATVLQYRLTNLACSGATIPAGILGKQDVNQLLVTPQIQQLFAQPKPNLVTLTIGANDAEWSKFITECYTTECGTANDMASITADLQTLTNNLQTALAQLQAHYGTNPPPVIVTGYHQVFPVTKPTTCSDLTGIDSSELAWGRQVQQRISDTIQTAVAEYSFVTFVPINFSGHELCSANAWVQGLADPDPYHPTQDGQTAFARQIVSAFKNLKLTK